MNKKSNKKNSKFLLPIIACTVIFAALVTVNFTKNNTQSEANNVNDLSQAVQTQNTSERNSPNEDSTPSIKANSDGNGNIIIPAADVSDNAIFVDYNSNGTNMQIMFVKADDGTIRGAFNTCQVCQGSPRAYFKQQGKNVQCQNCGNVFANNQIGLERGGCNPIPLEFKQTGNNIVISKSFLDGNASSFTNWKKGI